jgi:hypothetical protein
VSWSQNATRQLAIGRFVDHRQMLDKKRAPKPRSNCSCNGLAGTRRGWDGSGPEQDRVRCDDMSRNYPQTAALPIFLIDILSVSRCADERINGSEDEQTASQLWLRHEFR